MSGKLLLWAIRPHANPASLLATMRNSVVVGEAFPSGNPAGASRATRKVSPIPITALAFRHVADPSDTIIQSAPGKANGASTQEGENCIDRSLLSVELPPRSATRAPSPPKMRSTLYTGDELGSIKVWDMTGVLLDELGSTTCSARSTVDKATIPPAAGDRNPQEDFYHRQGPLDGVTMQAALRFRELMEIAKTLRGADCAPSITQTPGVGNKKSPYCSNTVNSANVSEGERNPQPVFATPSTKELATNIPGEGARAGAILRRRQDNGADEDGLETNNENIPRSPAAVANEAEIQDTGQKVTTSDQVEAVLNATVDTVEPMVSWTGHTDTVTFIQVIWSTLSPPCIQNDRSSIDVLCV